jgi:hypothetical protein
MENFKTFYCSLSLYFILYLIQFFSHLPQRRACLQLRTAFADKLIQYIKPCASNFLVFHKHLPSLNSRPPIAQHANGRCVAADPAAAPRVSPARATPSGALGHAGSTKFGRPQKTQAFFGAPELRPSAGVIRKGRDRRGASFQP